jgi:hypothetical protein
MRRTKTTRWVDGKGEDFHRYYFCNHCGFINDARRATISGDPEGRGGLIYSNPVNTTPPPTAGQTQVFRYEIGTGSGCAQCGSLNSRGKDLN